MTSSASDHFSGTVSDATAARQLGDEYMTAITKIVASHTVNELYARRSSTSRPSAWPLLLMKSG